MPGNGKRANELILHLNEQFSTGPLARTPQNLRAIRWGEKELEAAVREVDLVVNATSAGFDPKLPAILPARMMPSSLLVFDTVYGAGCEKLRREVETANAKWSDGVGMLLHQGAEAFTLWTGRDAPLEVMRQALQSGLSG
jgi:shikimate dehydrogenase